MACRPYQSRLQQVYPVSWVVWGSDREKFIYCPKSVTIACHPGSNTYCRLAVLSGMHMYFMVGESSRSSLMVVASTTLEDKKKNSGRQVLCSHPSLCLNKNWPHTILFIFKPSSLVASRNISTLELIRWVAYEQFMGCNEKQLQKRRGRIAPLGYRGVRKRRGVNWHVADRPFGARSGHCRPKIECGIALGGDGDAKLPRSCTNPQHIDTRLLRSPAACAHFRIISHSRPFPSC